MFRAEGLILLFSATLAAACAEHAPAPKVSVPPEREKPAAEVPGTHPPCSRIVRIEVWKQDRTLRAYCKRGAVIAMKVALGREEVGPKTRSGDQRTPEGMYRIAGTARPGPFHLFIPIDYPSREDAEAAFAEGRLSATAYEQIVEAHERGLPPPQDTALGGHLGFHGEGERWRGDSEHLDWTYGCIAVSDSEIEFVSERIEPGVPVWIHP